MLSYNNRTLLSDLSLINKIIGKDNYKLKNKTILITGGTGFFGSWLLNYLDFLNKDFTYNINLIVVTRSKKKFINENKHLDNKFINFIETDILNLKIKSTKIDFLIHMATTNASDTYNYNDTDKFEVLFEGTKKIVSFAVENGVKKIIFTSSGAVYGSHERSVSETSPYSFSTLDPNNTLAISKLAAEHFLSKLCEKNRIDYVILRCFSFIGNGLPLNIHYAAGNFVLDAMQNENIIIKGNGKEIRTYLDVRESIAWILKILVKRNKNKIYNFGSDRHIKIEDLAKKIAKIISPEKKIKILQKISLHGNIHKNIYAPNIKLLKDDYDFVQKLSLEDSILNMYENLE